MSTRRRRGGAEVMLGNSDCVFSVEDVQQGWHVHAWVELRDGAPRITELRLRSAEGSTLQAAQGGAGPQSDYRFVAGRQVPAGGITSPLLRSLKLSPLHDAIGKDNASAMTLGVHGFAHDEDFHGVRHPGRRGRDDYFYAVWAARYVEKAKTTRHPIAELAREYADEGKDERAIQYIIQTAKKRKLLVGGTPGRAGGHLTPKAERLLKEQGEK